MTPQEMVEIRQEVLNRQEWWPAEVPYPFLEQVMALIEGYGELQDLIRVALLFVEDISREDLHLSEIPSGVTFPAHRVGAPFVHREEIADAMRSAIGKEEVNE